MVAAGYTADELYSPENPDSLFRKNFLDFFEKHEWENLKTLRARAVQAFKGKRGSCRLWWAATRFLLRNQRQLARLETDGGLLNTARLEQWLDEQLRMKLTGTDPDFEPSGANGEVTFRDLPLPLKVIAADVAHRRIRVFTMPDDAQFVVASAVGASIGIPFIFIPKTDNGERFVDGGIMSNFPAWVFDSERKDAPPLTPTLGFRLVEPVSAARKRGGTATATPEPESVSLFSHVVDVFETAVFGDNTLETREVATLREIPLRVRIGPLDFEIDDQTKVDVFRDGKNDARDYFRKKSYIWRKSDEYMRTILQLVFGAMRDALGHDGHLRVNVMLPISNDRLQVFYTYNMDSETDYDDRLQFCRGSGACGLCWENLDYVICDLQDAAVTYKDKWRMDKRQQRLVRSSLRSLLCVPLFDQKRLQESGNASSVLRKAFVGVLNFDSDDDLLEKFTTAVSSDDNVAIHSAAMVARVLLGQTA